MKTRTLPRQHVCDADCWCAPIGVLIPLINSLTLYHNDAIGRVFGTLPFPQTIVRPKGQT